MLKDDRMMSMMTIVVVMFAIGTFINRSDMFNRLFGKEKAALELVRDDAVVRANQLIPIDVLANDKGIQTSDSERLMIAEQPKCGRAYARDGVVQYLAAQRCVGSQSFRYTISGRAGDQTGEVVAVVRLGEPTANEMPADTSPATGGNASAGAGTGAGTGATAPAPAPQTAATAPAQPPAGQQPGDLAAQSGTAAGNDASGAARSNATAVAIAGADDAPVPAPAEDAGPAGDAGTPPAPAATALATAAVDGEDAGGNARGNAGGNAGGNAVPLSEGASQPPVPGDPGSAAVPGAAVSDAAVSGAAVSGAAVSGAAVSTAAAPVAAGSGTAASGAGPSGPAASGPVVAAVPQPAAPCTTPPTLTLGNEPGGITEVSIDAPCQAGTVAELAYDGLRFAIALDRAGTGSVRAFGLQRASDAVVRFADRSERHFLLTFDDIERIERVVMVWDAPVDLELHAFEFGARPQDAGHVGPDRPRSFAEVRRRGGGFMMDYAPVDGLGQSLRVYSYWRGHDGRPGVVRLAVDFAGRDGPETPETCGDGAQAAPDFTVLRSTGGRIERPALRRLAALDCAAVAGLSDRLIGDAVDDLIVMQR